MTERDWEIWNEGPGDQEETKGSYSEGRWMEAETIPSMFE